MDRVENGLLWSLFSPGDVPGLADSFGEDFSERYRIFEKSPIPRKTVAARTVWDAMISAQIETGGPFMLYKDAINGVLYCAWIM